MNRVTAKRIAALFVMCTVSGFAGEPLFPNSIVSNNIDFICTDDPAVSATLTYEGRDRREMPDRRRAALFDEQAFVFEARFEDNTAVGLFAHSDFPSRERAERIARMLLKPLGQLPAIMRQRLSHVVLHWGDGGAYAEHLGRFFVLYTDNMAVRFLNNDLEETVFHESVHATLDHPHRDSAAWLSAQASDETFLTEYAANNPGTEDLAESALFAWTLIEHPTRLPAFIRERLVREMPGRLQFLHDVFSETDG